MHVETCRVCHNRLPEPFLDLGRTALANSFVSPDHPPDQEPTYPLRVVLCPACGLVQIDEEVPPETLFSEYIYVTGTSPTAVRHAETLAARCVERYDLGSSSLVLEAASNDGTVLRAFQQRGTRTLGVEPARNLAAAAVADGIDTVCAFFNTPAAHTLKESHGPASLFMGRHVLAHVADLHGFVAGVEHVLAPDGVAVVEVPHLLPFYRRLEYDTVYHEHLCYFSLGVLGELFGRAGLEIIAVWKVKIHGGSIVVHAQRRGGPREPDETVGRMLAEEKAAGLADPDAWDEFARRVAESQDRLRHELGRLTRGGKRVVGYGAPAKGMTLLASCGIGRETLGYLVDRSPNKQGLLTPGHRIPIRPPEALLEDQPDAVLMLAWNFAEEILVQQAEYLNRGGQFIMPIPEPHYHHAERLQPSAA